MTSQRKIEANRQNAKRSTGPKTDRGKAASSKNALKHGLAASSMKAMANCEAAAELIASLGGDDRDEPSSLVAQLTVYIVQVRQWHSQALSRVLDGEKPVELALKEAERLRRYETRAVSKRRKAMKEFAERKDSDLAKRSQA